MKSLLSAFCVVFSALGISQAAIIDIDSTTKTRSVEVVLEAGKYDISFVSSAFDAWNAWGRTRGCARDGTGCAQGWLTNLHIYSEEIGTIRIGSHGRFRSMELALANALPATIELSTRQSVRFFIADRRYHDNQGGVSVDIAQTAVPLPAAGLLFLGGIAALRMRRAKA